MEEENIYTDNPLDNQLFVEFHKNEIDKGKIRLLIEQGANINAIDKDGWNLLCHYIFDREEDYRDEIEAKIDLSDIQFMIDLGVDINYIGDENSGFDGFNCLYITVMARDYETTEFLLKAGANPNCVADDSGDVETLLDRATWELGTYAGIKKDKIWTEKDNAIWGLLCDYGAHSIENLDALQSVPKTNELRKLDTIKELQTFGNEAIKYKAYKPLLENLYENKMIYENKVGTFLVRLDEIEVTPEGISANETLICELRKGIISREKGKEEREEKKFFSSWHFMMWSSLDNCIHIPYVSCSLWFAERTIKKIEKLVAENCLDEVEDVLYEGNRINSKKCRQETTQQIIQEIEILRDFARCWENFNPYHIKKYLDRDVVYSSKWLKTELNGVGKVWQYWEYKLKQYSEKVEKGLVKAKIGYLKHKNKSCSDVFGYCKPCLVVTQRGKFADIISVIEIEIKDGQIVKINVDDVQKNDDRNRLVENPFSD